MKENPYTGWFKNTLTFLDAIIHQVPNFFCQIFTYIRKKCCLLYLSRKLIENNDIVCKLQLFEIVNELFLCLRVCQWTLGISNKVDSKVWKESHTFEIKKGFLGWNGDILNQSDYL